MFSLFANTPQKLEVDGQMLPLASILRRGTAIAVDLCMAVGIASVGFYLVSLMLPLDTSSAKIPIFVIMALVILYVALLRNTLFSPGRHLLRLRLARMPGPVPGLYGRSVTVHVDPEPTKDTIQTTRAVAAVGLSTVLALLALSAALQTTVVYQSVQRYTEAAGPLKAQFGSQPELSNVPRTLLISPSRAYVQVGAEWGEHRGILEFFLEREKGRPWEVKVARETAPHSFGHYSLGTSESEIPKP